MQELDYLKPFFEDNYQEIHVRAYAKLQKISPPTASKILKDLEKKNLLKCHTDKQHDLYKAAREDEPFIRLQQLYWYEKLQKCGLLEKLKMPNQIVILFGSLSKAETTPNSDIDIAIIGTFEKIDVGSFEKQLKRKIQLFNFETFERVPKNLKNAILNGYLLVRGRAYVLE